MEPQPYNMSKPADRARWYREMKGYLSLAGEDNFLIQGTDRPGRKYAWEAFLSIEKEFVDNSMEGTTTIFLTEPMMEWLRNGERSISSETIFEVMTGISLIRQRHCTPQDPSDFNRCYGLLLEVPEFRGRIKEVGETFPDWKPFTDNWDELEHLFEEELVREDGRAPKLYKRLHELNGR
jgi:hypothetical protein